MKAEREKWKLLHDTCLDAAMKGVEEGLPSHQIRGLVETADIALKQLILIDRDVLAVPSNTMPEGLRACLAGGCGNSEKNKA